MGLACKISGHKWDGCTCSRCGEYRDAEHKWVFEDQESKRKGQCREKCSVCGKMRDAEHVWDGCMCSRCGRVRNEGHKLGEFEPAVDNGYYFMIDGCTAKAGDGHQSQCVRCGRDVYYPHRFKKLENCRGRCKDCGYEADYHDFKNGVCCDCGVTEDRYYADLILSGRKGYSDFTFDIRYPKRDTYGSHVTRLETLLEFACSERCKYTAEEIAAKIEQIARDGERPAPSTEQKLFAIASDDGQDIRLREAALKALVDDKLKAKAKPGITRVRDEIDRENAMIAMDSGFGRSG